ncbi:MAG: alpha/beta fold hydrolase, partial [Holophagales bacterium]|nr:alpha/beta fold hydrolase [Holophagales bacterium]
MKLMPSRIPIGTASPTSLHDLRPVLALPFLLSALLAVACGPTTEEPADVAEVVERPSRQYSIQDFLDTVTYTGASFSPDGSSILVSSNPTGIFNAYAMPVAGGEPVALTRSTEESIFALAYFPEDERFLYSADIGGNELDHIYVQAADGTVTDLTPGENLKAIFLGFAWDDTTFLAMTNERDQRYFDVYEYQVDDYSRQRIFENNEGYNFGDMSSDRRWLAFSKTHGNADGDLYLYDLESGEMQHITPHEGDVAYGIAGFSPDGKALFFTTNENHEFRYLMRHDLDSGERKEVVKADWDVSFAGFSRGESYLVVGLNEDAKTTLRILDAQSLEPLPLPALPDAEITWITYSADESRMAFYASGSRTPNDLYVSEAGGEPRQLTRSLTERIDPQDLVEPDVVRFASFDDLEIPGILYTPHQAKAEGAKLPALVWVHGGPGGQSRVGYSGLIQYLVNHGYVVYAINNRGSSGYGKTFFHLDDRNHGKGDLGDCVASKQMLIDTGYVDPERIGIIGGSYGGFMVLAALTFQPEEFALGVNIFGVAN